MCYQLYRLITLTYLEFAHFIAHFIENARKLDKVGD